MPPSLSPVTSTATSGGGGNNCKFVRPTSLPLKPGTFVPKKLLPGAVSALPLISPETPRPNKSYGQLYIGGNAYTYLGLKCSTRNTFCTLHKSQPTYVPLSPEHNKVSMYSNWKVNVCASRFEGDSPTDRKFAIISRCLLLLGSHGGGWSVFTGDESDVLLRFAASVLALYGRSQ